MGINSNRNVSISSTDFSHWLTPQEAAERLKIPVKTLRKYLRAGVLPGVRIGTGFQAPWRIDPVAMRGALLAHKDVVNLADTADHLGIATASDDARFDEIQRRLLKLKKAGVLDSVRPILDAMGVRQPHELKPAQFSEFRGKLLALSSSMARKLSASASRPAQCGQGGLK